MDLEGWGGGGRTPGKFKFLKLTLSITEDRPLISPGKQLDIPWCPVGNIFCNVHVVKTVSVMVQWDASQVCFCCPQIASFVHMVFTTIIIWNICQQTVLEKILILLVRINHNLLIFVIHMLIAVLNVLLNLENNKCLYICMHSLPCLPKISVLLFTISDCLSKFDTEMLWLWNEASSFYMYHIS